MALNEVVGNVGSRLKIGPGLFPIENLYVWLKSQVERSRSIPVFLFFGYKVTRMEWLQLGNILLRSGTIPLQKINRTEPLRS
jgi:hypothetical protein